MTALKRLRLVLPFTLLACLLGLAAATQAVAVSFHYPREFGRGLVDLAGMRVYPPWAVLGWYGRYAAAYPRAFDEASLWGLAAAMIPMGAAIGVARRIRRNPPAFGAEAWADGEDVRRAKLIDPKGEIHGRVLGRFGGRYLTYSGVEHAIIVGASRSGKGAGHVVPTLVAWPQSVFVYDRKGELWHITADHRKRFSHVFYFAPTDPATVRWNPLFEVRKGVMEIADIQNVVGILVDPLGRKAGDLNFWDQSATDFFTALILHVLYSEPDERKNLAQVRRLLIHIEPTLHAMMNTHHRHRPDLHAADGLARDADDAPIPEVHPEIHLIAAALADKRVVEVMVNPDGKIWTDRIGEGRAFTGHYLEVSDADRILRLLADHVGEVVTRDRPRISATLPETGERFQGVFMPLVANPAFTIRKRPEVIFTRDDYVGQGVLSPAQVNAIRAAAETRQNLLIAGGTGSGKTTLANAILAEPAFAKDRVVLIEDIAELQCSAADKLEMLTKRAEPTVTMADLVQDTLRLRPDRIVIGEVRDGSALDLLKAWNTGHPGGLATIHANSAAEALVRLEDLIGEVTQRLPYRAIAQAINLVIFIERTPTGRRIRSVSRVLGWDGERYQLEAATL